MLVPAGTIIQFAGVVEPGGWFLCNGRSLAKVDYEYLFSMIGYIYGGSGANFNIPDMRGRVGVCAGTGAGLSARAVGEAGGEESHVLSVGEMPSHNHTLVRKSNPDNGAYDSGNAHASESSAATTDRAILGTFTTNNTGSSAAHNNMQPFMVVQYLIKY